MRLARSGALAARRLVWRSEDEDQRVAAFLGAAGMPESAACAPSGPLLGAATGRHGGRTARPRSPPATAAGMAEDEERKSCGDHWERPEGRRSELLFPEDEDGMARALARGSRRGGARPSEREMMIAALAFAELRRRDTRPR